MQRTYTFTILSILLFIGVTACTGSKASDPATTIADIETLIDIGDMRSAKEKADRLCNDTTAGLSTDQLCRLSIAYMKMSDAFETDNNTAMATRCYRMAINSDSAVAATFYAELPLDESRHVDLMSKLDLLLSTDREAYLDEISNETEYQTSDQ